MCLLFDDSFPVCSCSAFLSCINLKWFVDTEEEWTTCRKIVGVLENDPVFDKSQRCDNIRFLSARSGVLKQPSRDFMAKSERYIRGLALIDRVYELEEIHKWTPQETNLVISTLDEQLPINLHNVGKLGPVRFATNESSYSQAS